jgi:hypothetical protein
MVVVRGVGAAPFEVALEPRLRSLVEGNEAAFSKLRASDYDAVRGDVLKAQPDRLGDAHSRARQQRDERAVGVSPERTIGLSYRSNEMDNVLGGKDIRASPVPPFTAEDGRRRLVGLVLGAHVPGEMDHIVQTAGLLMN